MPPKKKTASAGDPAPTPIARLPRRGRNANPAAIIHESYPPRRSSEQKKADDDEAPRLKELATKLAEDEYNQKVKKLANMRDTVRLEDSSYKEAGTRQLSLDQAQLASQSAWTSTVLDREPESTVSAKSGTKKPTKKPVKRSKKLAAQVSDSANNRPPTHVQPEHLESSTPVPQENSMPVLQVGSKKSASPASGDPLHPRGDTPPPVMPDDDNEDMPSTLAGIMASTPNPFTEPDQGDSAMMDVDDGDGKTDLATPRGQPKNATNKKVKAKGNEASNLTLGWRALTEAVVPTAPIPSPMVAVVAMKEASLVNDDSDMEPMEAVHRPAPMKMGLRLDHKNGDDAVQEVKVQVRAQQSQSAFKYKDLKISDVPLRTVEDRDTWHLNFVPATIAWAACQQDPFGTNENPSHEQFIRTQWAKNFPGIKLGSTESKEFAAVKKMYPSSLIIHVT
ncbi:hypothetical protein OF83DRAFT_1292718 [Amylostereum chailletii]|nr:hypothetical protein OF83DRAFT_1292718 [Amylostereum chailletii]